MARKPSNNGQAAAAKGNRDIRAFFRSGQAAKRTQPALSSSQASGGSATDTSATSSSAAGPELPNDGALTSNPSRQARGANALRQSAGRSKRSSTVQDENSKPVTDDLDDASASSVSPPRPAIIASGSLTSTSLSELCSTPSLPPSHRQRLVRTPRRQGSGTKTLGQESADPSMPFSGRTTASSRKVRFQSEPSSPTQPAEPDEPDTPRRFLFPEARKVASVSPPDSPVNLLSSLPSLKRERPLGTPKRSFARDTISNGTPNSLPPLPDLRSSPSIPSSPSTAKKRPTLTRDTVIKGSDEEDDDDSFSDCSLPDLDMLGPSKPETNSCGTPKAKRRAMVHHSPLTIQPKHQQKQQQKHRFDFKTLDAHSKRHDVMFDSPKQPREAEVKDEVMKDAEASPSKARQKLIEIAGVNTEEDAGKALRAMERADAGSRTRWYFFKQDADSLKTPIAFPKKRAKGPWAFLQKAQTRDRHIMSGMPTSLAVSLGLPDELYYWVLDMVNVEPISVLREEYCRLAAANKKQVRRLITPQRLSEVFRQLGAADHIGDETLKPVREIRDIYADRDWKPLQSYLEWLHNIARYLEYDTIAYAVKMLLRMAVDKMVLENLDVLMCHQHALGALVGNVEDGIWNEFCTEICSSLYHGFDKSSLRILPLTCMPVISAKLHELRRRLATAFFLRDASLANQDPDLSISLRLVIARVKDSDFQINRKTDYADLKAQVQLLDMAVDDGSFVPDEDNREHEKKFNAEIDDLAKRLKAIWRSINDTGAANLSRTEAKSVLEWVGQRLTYSVRTKPPPTQSIFGEQGPSSAKKKRQQDFMHKFVHSRKTKQAQDVIKDDMSSGEDDSFMTAHG